MKYLICILFFATFFGCSLFQSQQGNEVERDFIENHYYNKKFDSSKIIIDYDRVFLDTTKLIQYIKKYDTDIILCNLSKDTISSEDSLYSDSSLDEVEYIYNRNYYYKIKETKHFIEFQFATYKNETHFYLFNIYESESCNDTNRKSIIYKPVDSHPVNEPY